MLHYKIISFFHLLQAELLLLSNCEGGRGIGSCWTCDFIKQSRSFNAAYRSSAGTWKPLDFQLVLGLSIATPIIIMCKSII